MAQTRKQKVLQEVKRKRQQRTIVSIVIVAVLISIIGIGVWALSRNAGNGGNFPFQCLGQEYTNLHVHPWLRIWINTGTGITNVTIPAAVGILNPGFQTDSNGVQVVSNGSCYEPMHTHDASGIIHIESSSISNQYTLDNFFDIWKVTCQIQASDCVNIGGVNRPIVFRQSAFPSAIVAPPCRTKAAKTSRNSCRQRDGNLQCGSFRIRSRASIVLSPSIKK